MALGWQVLDIKSRCQVRYRRGRLVIHRDDAAEVAVPLADVAVVLLGQQAHIQPGVIAAAMQRDVSVLFCDWRGVPTGGAYAWNETTRVGARNRAQARLSKPRRKNAWGRIVRAKISGQAHTLGCASREGRSHLLKVANTVRSGDPDNREAQAARFYWERIFGSEEFSRLPGAPEGRNAMLNYAYTVLRGHGVRAVLSAGLAPALSLFHEHRSNAFALVDDIIEPFRPAIDFTVAQLDASSEIENGEVRRALVGASNQGFGTGYRLTTELNRLAQQLGRYVEGDIETLDVPVWTGPEQVKDDDE